MDGHAPIPIDVATAAGMEEPSPTAAPSVPRASGPAGMTADAMVAAVSADVCRIDVRDGVCVDMWRVDPPTWMRIDYLDGDGVNLTLIMCPGTGEIGSASAQMDAMVTRNQLDYPPAAVQPKGVMTGEELRSLLGAFRTLNAALDGSLFSFEVVSANDNDRLGAGTDLSAGETIPMTSQHLALVAVFLDTLATPSD